MVLTKVENDSSFKGIISGKPLTYSVADDPWAIRMEMELYHAARKGPYIVPNFQNEYKAANQIVCSTENFCLSSVSFELESASCDQLVFPYLEVGLQLVPPWRIEE